MVCYTLWEGRIKMRDYELVLIFDPDLTEAKRKKEITKVKKSVTDFKGKVGTTEEWGKRELAYSIRGKSMGYYFLWVINLPEKSLQDLDKKLRLEEGVIRHLLVRRELIKERRPHSVSA